MRIKQCHFRKRKETMSFFDLLPLSFKLIHMVSVPEPLVRLGLQGRLIYFDWKSTKVVHS